MSVVDVWYLDHLVCPRDHQSLTLDGTTLRCASGHRYQTVDGVPVMLVEEASETIDITHASIRAALNPQSGDPLQLATLSLSNDERAGIAALARETPSIDPVVSYLVAATNGLMYKHLIGRLDRYPIPPLPMPDGNGKRLLDVGCSWGRWTLAASERGYDAVGIDPSLGAVLAARRVAKSLERPVRFVVGDARQLPFGPATFDAVYSYSVLQHLSYDDAARAIGEIGRVMSPGGAAKVQMPTTAGVRCLYHQARRRFRDAVGFEVRYWTWRRLRDVFASGIGPTRFDVDCYFGIGLQAADAHLMTPALHAVVNASEWMKRAARVFPPLQRVADSVFVESTKAGA